MAASIGINKLLNLIRIFGDDYELLTQIELKDGFMIESSTEIKYNCVCQKRRALADKRRILN